MEWLIAELRSAGIIILRLVGVVIGAVVLCWVASLIKQKTRTSTPTVEPSNSVNLNGFKYTVTRVHREKSIGFATAEDGASYLVVDLEVENQMRSTEKYYAEFHILSEEGFRYNEDTGATRNVKNGHRFGVEILPKFSKPVTVVFLVPIKALSQSLTLDIEHGFFSEVIKIESASGINLQL